MAAHPQSIILLKYAQDLEVLRDFYDDGVPPELDPRLTME